MPFYWDQKELDYLHANQRARLEHELQVSQISLGDPSCRISWKRYALRLKPAGQMLSAPGGAKTVFRIMLHLDNPWTRVICGGFYTI